MISFLGALHGGFLQLTSANVESQGSPGEGLAASGLPVSCVLWGSSERSLASPSSPQFPVRGGVLHAGPSPLR